MKQMLMQQSETAATITAKAAPPAAVITASLMGYPVDDWIKWITLLYVILMLLHKMWHMALEAYKFWVLHDKHADGDGEDDHGQ